MQIEVRGKSMEMERRWLIAILSVCFLGSAVQAQVNTAAIFGSVVDSSGQAIASANISITNTATNAVLRTTTSGEGLFSLNPLLPGEYEIVIGSTDFEERHERGVRLTAGERLRTTYTLNPATVKQTVEVTGDAA